jgi:hypothetical protein
MIGWLVKDELEMMCKEVLVVDLRYYPIFLHEAIEENHEHASWVSSLRVEFQTRYY